MYADVVVLTYQAPDINSFTYLVPKTLQGRVQVGQLVEAPFGNRTPLGVVIGTRDLRHGANNDIKIKPINKIIFSTPLLLPYQIELLKWMSAYYIAPMVNCLEAMLPTAALNAKQLTLRSNSGQATNSNTKYKILNTKYQSIVLVPTINRIPETLAQFPKAKNYSIYHSELKPAEKLAMWMKIIDGKVDYVFGSRSAIFAPCPNLKEIIIFDEHDGAYKDERSPYYDTLTVTQKISAISGCKLKITDSSPKIQTYFSMSKSITFTKTKAKSTIVSMKAERLAQNYSAISQSLSSQLTANFKSGKNSLLFLNKKKESGSLFCKSCKTHHYLEKQPAACPNCGSSDFYFNVLNIYSLAKEVQKLIPGTQVSLIDQTHHSSLITHHLIDIATATIFYTPLLKKYDLVAHIQTDTLLNRADFSSSEALYDQITNLKALLKENGVLILQTYETENLIINAAASGDYPSYHNEQLKLRRALFYPPFALLIKLTIKGKDQEKVEQKAHEITNRLKYQIQNTKYKIPVTILGPFPPFFFSKMPTFNIIIKYKLESFDLAAKEEAIKNLQHLRNLKDVRVEVEPESIN